MDFEQITSLNVAGMNIIALSVLSLTALAILLGFLSGLMRGSRRALLRLVLVVICAVVAFFTREVITNVILNLDAATVGIGEAGQTVEQYIVAQLGDLQSMGDIVISLVKIIVNIVTFLVMFIGLKIVTWLLVFPICKIFVKKGPKKRALIGGVFGLVQGVVVALCIMIPITGLLSNGDKVLTLVDEVQNIDMAHQTSSVVVTEVPKFDIVVADAGGSDVTYEHEEGDSSELIAVLLSDYRESAIGKLYDKIGEKPFSWIASTKTKDGKLTLSGVLGSASKMMEMASVLPQITSSFENIDFTNPESFSDLKSAMAELDRIKDSMTDEEKETVNTVMKSVITGMAEGAVGEGEEGSAIITAIAGALDDVDFMDIGFEEEIDNISQIITDISDMTSEDAELNEETVTKLVTDMGKSDLVVPIIENLSPEDLGLGDIGEMDEETKNEIIELLDATVEADENNQRIVDALKAMLGLTSSQE